LTAVLVGDTEPTISTISISQLARISPNKLSNRTRLVFDKRLLPGADLLISRQFDSSRQLTLSSDSRSQSIPWPVQASSSSPTPGAALFLLAFAFFPTLSANEQKHNARKLVFSAGNLCFLSAFVTIEQSPIMFCYLQKVGIGHFAICLCWCDCHHPSVTIPRNRRFYWNAVC